MPADAPTPTRPPSPSQPSPSRPVPCCAGSNPRPRAAHQGGRHAHDAGRPRRRGTNSRPPRRGLPRYSGDRRGNLLRQGRGRLLLPRRSPRRHRRLLRGTGEYTVNLALIRGDRPSAAVVAAPALARIWIAGTTVRESRIGEGAEATVRAPDFARRRRSATGSPWSAAGTATRRPRPACRASPSAPGVRPPRP